ncbi:unnamed protein product, partial [Amoebophrya sp. A25]
STQNRDTTTAELLHPSEMIGGSSSSTALERKDQRYSIVHVGHSVDARERSRQARQPRTLLRDGKTSVSPNAASPKRRRRERQMKRQDHKPDGSPGGRRDWHQGANAGEESIKGDGRSDCSEDESAHESAGSCKEEEELAAHDDTQMGKKLSFAQQKKRRKKTWNLPFRPHFTEAGWSPTRHAHECSEGEEAMDHRHLSDTEGQAVKGRQVMLGPRDERRNGLEAHSQMSPTPSPHAYSKLVGAASAVPPVIINTVTNPAEPPTQQTEPVRMLIRGQTVPGGAEYAIPTADCNVPK